MRALHQFAAVLTGMLIMLPASALPCSAAGAFAARVEHAAIEAACGHIEPPDRLETFSARFGGADPLAASGCDLELAAVEGPNASGVINVRFRMVVDGIPRGEARASVRGRIRGPALQTARLLPRDSVIGSTDLQVKEADLTRLLEKPLRSPEEAVGLVALRTYGKGRILTAALVAEAPVVSRGQTVALLVESEGLVVRALGVALRDGAAGEIVPAENSRTGAKVEGLVLPDGSLRVIRPSGARRS